MILQEGLTEKDFTNYSQFARESEKYLKSNIKSSDFKRSLSNISMEEILGFIQEGMKQYPFSKEDFSEEQLEKIYKDIPSIGNKQDAQSKKSVAAMTMTLWKKEDDFICVSRLKACVINANF